MDLDQRCSIVQRLKVSTVAFVLYKKKWETLRKIDVSEKFNRCWIWFTSQLLVPSPQYSSLQIQVELHGQIAWLLGSGLKNYCLIQRCVDYFVLL